MLYQCCKCDKQGVVGIRATYRDEDEEKVGYRYFCEEHKQEEMSRLLSGVKSESQSK